jgi:hypothetical protein
MQDCFKLVILYLLSGHVFLVLLAGQGPAVDLVLDDGRVVAVTDARRSNGWRGWRWSPRRHQA